MQHVKDPVIKDTVIVIGAGLSGLAAAASAAQRGARVLVLEATVPGGRARTDEKSGFRFNQGPHALYRGGAGRAVLRRLGVKVHGHNPPLRGSLGLVDGALRPMPLTPRKVGPGGLLGARSAAQVGRVLAAVSTDGRRRSRWEGRSCREWLDSQQLRPDAEAFLAATVRVTSYVADLERMPAELALSQIKTGVRGVDYLDGGWQSLVDGLRSVAVDAGAAVREHARVVSIDGEPGRWEVAVANGRAAGDGGEETLVASAVVLAAGGPDVARHLLPVEPHWPMQGPDVTAACLELGLGSLRSRIPGSVASKAWRFVLGVDEPLYLSPHCPPGDLAPEGSALLHVMRYGATEARKDRDRLRRLAASAGVSPEDVVAERFLARMVVSRWLPSPALGIREGRPPVQVAEVPGVFIAGDWIGPVGWLADAALASGERAGELAAGAATGNRAVARRAGVAA